MSETVLEALEVRHEMSILGMPDTDIFEETNPYSLLALSFGGSSSWRAAIWATMPWQVGRLGSTRLEEDRLLEVVDKDPNRDFGSHWGALAWNQTQDELILPDDPHIGYGLRRAIETGAHAEAVTLEGVYWDLGTPNEYARYLLSANQ
jgi:hypothetical protein